VLCNSVALKLYFMLCLIIWFYCTVCFDLYVLLVVIVWRDLLGYGCVSVIVLACLLRLF